MARAKRRRLWRFLPWVIIAGILTGLAVLVVHKGRQNYDSATLCPNDGNYPRTAVLIDATDPLTDGQIKALVDNINGLHQPNPSIPAFEPVALHEWVGIFVLDADDLLLPKPTVALCYPGSKDDANPLWENPALIQKRYEEKFRIPMKDAIERLKHAPEQTSSPILEMIGAVALDGHFDASKKRRFIVVSDMLQNTAAYSHYRDGADYAKWRDAPHSRDFLQPSLLRGVMIEIWYLKRADSPARDLQTRGHIAFWQQYFRDVGAEVAIVRPI